MIDDEAVKAIENLHRLKNDGVLSEAEFEAAKQRILFGTPRTEATAAPSLGRPFAGELPATEDTVGWATLPLRRYADFGGRSGRREFWLFQLIPLGLFVAAYFLIQAAGTDRYGDWNAFGSLTAGTLGLAFLGLTIPQIAVQVRRFHDQDRSGWLAALNLVPVIGPIAVFVFMLIEGTAGENQFGPDPGAVLP